ncbi:hypothetical protein [Microbacterium sp. gxy059]|uniref:hypothetical protein n=1 Tax=Microbacterium sp. gxy059 TaxID=2957199 RepID=UPI003D98DC80
MTNGLAPAEIAVSIGAFAGSAVFVVLSCWWRAGRSPAARWWVRDRLPWPDDRPAYDQFALVYAPRIAELLFALGVLAILGPLYTPVTGTGLAVALVLVQTGIIGFAGFLGWRRRFPPLWVYPAWLRETRREEIARLQPPQP